VGKIQTRLFLVLGIGHSLYLLQKTNSLSQKKVKLEKKLAQHAHVHTHGEAGDRELPLKVRHEDEKWRAVSTGQ
jgi:hypothetical protein